MGAGRSSALVEHEVDVVVAARLGVGAVVELGAFHHLGGRGGSAGPVAVLLGAAVAVPRVVVHGAPVVGAGGGVLEIHVEGVGLEVVGGLEGVAAGHDAAHLAALEQAGLEGAGLVDVHRCPALHLGAAGGGLGAVGGVDHGGATGGTHGREPGVEGVAILAVGLVDPGRLGRFLEEVLIVVAAHDLGVLRRGDGSHAGAHCRHEVAMVAVHLHGIVGGCTLVVHIGAGVGDAGQLAGVDHAFYFLLVGLPVLQEDAWGARHGQQVGVGGQGVFLDGVLGRARRAILGVVVLDEGHGILAVGRLRGERGAAQAGPVALVDGIAHGVAERVVEGCAHDHAAHLGRVEPVDHLVGVAVPVLAHREGRLRGTVVEARKRAVVALHHVVAKARVAQVVEQEAQVGLHDGLHIGALVVEVAHAAPVLARVVVARQGHALLGSLRGRCAAVVVGANVGRGHCVGHAVVGLGGEGEPVAGRLAVVDHHVGNGAYALALERADERAQLLLVAKRAVVVAEPVQVVVAHRGAAAVAALRYPHQAEVGRQFAGLRLECGPVGVVVGVPVEALQHHAPVVCRPSCCPGHHGQRSQRQKHINLAHVVVECILNSKLVSLFDSPPQSYNQFSPRQPFCPRQNRPRRVQSIARSAPPATRLLAQAPSPTGRSSF